MTEQGAETGPEQKYIHDHMAFITMGNVTQKAKSVTVIKHYFIVCYCVLDLDYFLGFFHCT